MVMRRGARAPRRTARRPITPLAFVDRMATVLALILLGAALCGLLLVIARSGRVLVERGLAALDDKLDRRLGDLDARVDRRFEGLDGRLLSSQQSAGQTASQIAERLGKLDGTAAQMLARANDLARLEHALRPPKARGGFGELLLGNLLRDALPPDAYALQHGFRGGERVDAVIKVDRLLSVDAKFPLDNFERLVEASEDSERQLAERAFARDVKSHVDAIASKYIRPAEGTYDFAFMYLPSESVYYELVCGKTGALFQHALEKRVFPVSPSTFHAYLGVIVLGLKGLQIEHHAQEVMAYTAQLGKDFERFRTDFEVVGKHIANAHSKFGEADRKLDRLEVGLERASDWQAAVEPADETPELPRALDAA
jgi:DNA recombination protein RmuC